jgi:heme-degrading monooxygenase HmoA
VKCTLSIIKPALCLVKRDEVAKTRRLLQWERGEHEGFKGLVVIHSLHDPQEIIALTFWETKQDMDAFHAPYNKLLTSLQEKTEPNREGDVERRDHAVSHHKMR